MHNYRMDRLCHDKWIKGLKINAAYVECFLFGELVKAALGDPQHTPSIHSCIL